MAHYFNSKDTIVKEVLLHSSGVFYYNDESGKKIRVLKDENLIREIADMVKMIPITNGHNGDVCISDGYSKTETGGAAIGTTGSNVRLVEEGGRLKLYIDSRLQKGLWKKIKASGKSAVSLGGVGRNKKEPGEHPLYGPYDARQYLDSVSHVAIVETPRVEGSRILDEKNSDNIVIFENGENNLMDGNNMVKKNEDLETSNVNDSLEAAVATQAADPAVVAAMVNQETATEAKATNEPAEEPKAAEETKEEVQVEGEENETAEAVEFSKGGVTNKDIKELLDLVHNTLLSMNKQKETPKEQEPAPESEVKAVQEPKDEDLDSFLGDVSVLIGQVPNDVKGDAKELEGYLTKKLELGPLAQKMGLKTLPLQVIQGIVAERIRVGALQKQESVNAINDSKPNDEKEKAKNKRLIRAFFQQR